MFDFTINNIVYSDTVLPLKDMGKDIKVTSLKVDDYLLEECIETITEENPNIKFNTIQYSKENKTVYFYTDKNISMDKWVNRNIHIRKPLVSSKDFLEEISRLLKNTTLKDENIISLYDISNLMKAKKNEFNDFIDHYKDLLMSENSKDHCYIDFDYGKKELNVSLTTFNFYGDDLDEEYTFKKANDIYISKEENGSDDILINSGKTLSELYDKFEEYKDYENGHCYGIRSINSSFLVNISSYETSISNDRPIYASDFELSLPNSKDKYRYKCNSSKVGELIKNHEDEIFKRIYVKIDDLPLWMRDILYNKRKDIIKIELKQEKRQKRKQKIKRFFHIN